MVEFYINPYEKFTFETQNVITNPPLNISLEAGVSIS